MSDIAAAIEKITGEPFRFSRAQGSRPKPGQTEVAITASLPMQFRKFTEALARSAAYVLYEDEAEYTKTSPQIPASAVAGFIITDYALTGVTAPPGDYQAKQLDGATALRIGYAQAMADVAEMHPVVRTFIDVRGTPPKEGGLEYWVGEYAAADDKAKVLATIENDLRSKL